jgi:hypothetical protein
MDVVEPEKLLCCRIVACAVRINKKKNTEIADTLNMRNKDISDPNKPDIIINKPILLARVEVVVEDRRIKVEKGFEGKNTVVEQILQQQRHKCCS